MSNGKLFRQRIEKYAPLQIVGTINAYSALLAQKAGCKALYLSGAGVANASFGLPDLGMTSLDEVLEEARRILEACPLPLLVDIDTGWGSFFTITRAITRLERAGVAAVHIEDQTFAKRCGHRPNKKIVAQEVFGDRIKAAVDARTDPDFVIMARTDALADEGFEAALDRLQYAVSLGADMVFIEAVRSLEEYQRFCKQLSVPVLANCTEFGKTPLFTREELQSVGVSMILYPLSAFRAMAEAALAVYESIIHEGSQQSQLKNMQTRDALYAILEYPRYESQLDAVERTHNEQ